MSLSVTRWTADEEQAIARIMAAESLTRIEAIQAMQRRKRAAKSLSHRLKLQDPFDSAADCQKHGQKRRCLDCASASGETDPEMTAFLDMMLNGKKQSGAYFIVERDPDAEMRAGSTVFRGLYPVSARVDDLPEPDEWLDLITKEPYEAALELTEAGIIESRVYSRVHRVSEHKQPTSLTSDESEILAPSLNMGVNVDGLIPGSPELNPEDHSASEGSLEPNKALRGRGRPKMPESQKRLSAAARQARWREKQRVG